MTDAGQFCLYARTGEFITTLDVPFEHNYVLNDYGTCRFTLPRDHAKALRKYLDNGMRVFIRHENLPNWGGTIDGDLDWGNNGEMVVNAYGGEYLLNYRSLPDDGGIWERGSAGAMFTALSNYANNLQDQMIRIGETYGGGGSVSEPLDGKSVYEHVKALGKTSGFEWNVEPLLVAGDLGRLYFYANFYQQRGEVLPFLLEEGNNISARQRPLRVQGKIINMLTGYGEADDPEARPKWTERDDDSIARHGLRQGNVTFNGVKDLAMVKTKTQAMIKKTAYQRNTFNIEAINKNDTFSKLKLGNTMSLKLTTAGFWSDTETRTLTDVRILGMKYASSDDTVELTVDEVV